MLLLEEEMRNRRGERWIFLIGRIGYKNHWQRVFTQKAKEKKKEDHI